MAKSKKISFQTQAEQNIKDDAEFLARATQTPGQTKQQTKLIAQGIAKGIAEYKRREKAKARELNRTRKQKAKRATPAEIGDSSPAVAGAGSRRFALRSAGVVFMLISASHLTRAFLGANLVVGNFFIPPWWSALASLATVTLAGWMFAASRR